MLTTAVVDLHIKCAISIGFFEERRKMKRRSMVLTIGLVVLQFCCSSLWARPTTAYEAEMLVAGWLKADAQPLGTALGRSVTKVETFTDQYGSSVYYIVYLQPSGFVIVPADDLVEPIIGFADDGTYDPSLDNPLGALVTKDLNGRVAAVRNAYRLYVIAQEETVLIPQSKWRHFVSLGEAVKDELTLMWSGSVSDVRVAPLMGSKWGQHDVCDENCYNYYTPNNYPCGCIATAMAQLMRYHQHPEEAIGVNEFVIKVDGDEETASTQGGDRDGGPYRWFRMVLEPGCSTTLAQRQAIGAICYDAGVATHTEYWDAGSSSSLPEATRALRDTFMYSNAIHGWNNDNNIGSERLDDMVNPNLDADNPVILGISRTENEEAYGHAVVCDGYGYNASTLYHHLNMGWSGSDDAWYNLPTISSDPSYRDIVGCVYNIFTSGSGEIISGRVTDRSGNPISGATVTAAVAGQGTGGPYTVITNSKGIYALVNVRGSWTCTVSVTKPGCYFTPQRVTTGASSDDSSISGNKWGINFVGDYGRPSRENFETGYFSKFPWEHDGDASWTITSQENHSGTYSVRAAEIEDSESTTLRVTLDCASGNIIFFRKVSCESNCDYLEFYIDGAEKGKWSGEEDWTEVSLPVTAGTRTFEWTYSKNYSGSHGDDTVWIDDIVFPIPAAAKIAHDPDPPDGAESIYLNVILSWTAGFDARRHDVYFGDNIDDVRDADITDTTGIYRGRQNSIIYTPPEPLEFERTYYWRVDEYNTDATISEGDVWSFTMKAADPLSEALDTTWSFTTGGSAKWFAQTTTSYYDGDAAESGDILHSEESWMRMIVSGTGTVKFHWRVSSEEGFDFMNFYINGSLKDRISGLCLWQQKRYTISTLGLHVLEWRYVKDAGRDCGSDCGWVDKVEWVTPPEPPSPSPPPPPPFGLLSEALDTDLSFTTGGSANWFATNKTSYYTTSYYGGDAAQSGDISHDEESWMRTTVSGKGTVKFYWNVSSHLRHDFLEFYIDGSLKDQISGSRPQRNWEAEMYVISTAGPHLLEWRYVKDGENDSGMDCGWVDKVEWVPAP